MAQEVSNAGSNLKNASSAVPPQNALYSRLSTSVTACRSQDRSKWLAHGRHSELFQVVAFFKRSVLKVMPIVAGDFSKGRLETIATAIECYL